MRLACHCPPGVRYNAATVCVSSSDHRGTGAIIPAEGALNCRAVVGDGDVRGGGQPRGPKDGRCYALVAGSPQSDSVNKGVGTGIIRIEIVDGWKDSGPI